MSRIKGEGKEEKHEQYNENTEGFWSVGVSLMLYGLFATDSYAMSKEEINVSVKASLTG